MDIAAMNVRITFQKNAVITDKYGNHKNEWTDYFSYTGRYFTHKRTYQDFLHAKNKGKFRSEHRMAISEYESARDWLQSHAKARTLPSYKYIDTPAGKFPGTANVKEARDAQIAAKTKYRQEYNAAMLLQVPPSYRAVYVIPSVARNLFLHQILFLILTNPKILPILISRTTSKGEKKIWQNVNPHRKKPLKS